LELRNSIGNRDCLQSISKRPVRTKQQLTSSKLEAELKRYVDIDGSLKDNYAFLKSYIALKNKDILKLTIDENQRSNDFIRLYPSKGCNIYDKYFCSKRSSNVFIYKALFTESILPLEQQDYTEAVAPTAPKIELSKNIRSNIRSNSRERQATPINTNKKTRTLVKKNALSSKKLSNSKTRVQPEYSTLEVTQDDIKNNLVKPSRPQSGKIIITK
jgi:hypothetical protein